MAFAFTDPNSIRSISQLEDEFKKFFLIVDPYVIKTLIASIIANRIPHLDPIWLFLVAASSAGKTEFINTVEGLPFIFPIDTLTANTFASGQTKPGQETSLLHKLPGNTGIFTFKDFTVVLNMNPMAREEIMGQLRGIFDGSFVKRTGNGKDIIWRGKVGMLAAVTTVIHQRQAEFASMGERFIQYEMIAPNRRLVQQKIFERKKLGVDNIAIRNHLRGCVHTYINYVLNNTPPDLNIELDETMQEAFFQISDYVTMARSGLEKDKRSGAVNFIPDPEMPSRMNGQLITLAHGLMAINMADPNIKSKSNLLPADDLAILYKVALDSIPRKRRRALQTLAQYRLGLTTKGLAIKEKYATEVIRETLQELNALGFCNRAQDGSHDKWLLDEEWRDIITNFEKLSIKDEILEAKDSTFSGDLEEDYSEHNATMRDAFDNW